MSYVTWPPSIATGIEEIDNDHKGLFDLVDQFHEAYARGGDRAEMECVFKVLMEYTARHFRREMEFFVRIEYPDSEAHQRSHEELKREVEALYARFLTGELRGEETDLGLELLAFLNNWLHFHIMEEDMAYKAFLEEKG